MHINMESFKVYDTTIAFLYSWSLISLSFAYGFDLLLTNGIVSRPMDLGPEISYGEFMRCVLSFVRLVPFGESARHASILTC